jgi:hypothetical protein
MPSSHWNFLFKRCVHASGGLRAMATQVGAQLSITSGLLMARNDPARRLCLCGSCHGLPNNHYFGRGLEPACLGSFGCSLCCPNRLRRRTAYRLCEARSFPCAPSPSSAARPSSEGEAVHGADSSGCVLRRWPNACRLTLIVICSGIQSQGQQVTGAQPSGAETEQAASRTVRLGRIGIVALLCCEAARRTLARTILSTRSTSNGEWTRSDPAVLFACLFRRVLDCEIARSTDTR